MSKQSEIDDYDTLTAVFVREVEGFRVPSMVESFMKNLDDNGDGVVGFDAEWSSNGAMMRSGQLTRVSRLLFSNANHCFIYLSSYGMAMLPDPLLSFLRHPEFTFVGIGIEENMAKLEKDFEAGCKNAVELGALAAEVTKNPRLRHCGINLLEQGIWLPKKIQRPCVVYQEDDGDKSCTNARVFSDYKLDREQLSRAVTNTCAYHRIGKRLLLG